MSKKFYSKEQTETARNTNILEYLISKGETFKKQGYYYRHTEHSSWVYDDKKKVIHFNKSTKTPTTNSCVSAAMEVYGYNFREAVGDILGSEAEVLTEKDFIIEPHQPLNYKKDIKHAKSFFHAYNYLVNEREIDPEVVNAFKKNQLIGEDVRENIIFRYVNRETNNVNDIVGVELRGTKFIEEEKRLIPDRAYYLFQHPGNDEKSMFYAALTNVAPTGEMKVFEAGIEVMSYLSLNKDKYLKSIQKNNTDFCSMGGLKHVAVEEHFKKVVDNNREMAKDQEKAVVPKITLCVNNDEAGIEFVDRFKDYMKEKGYSDNFIKSNITTELPESEISKSDKFDYNDLLKEKNRIKLLVSQEMQKRQEETVIEN
ncbi:DUF3991 domain-containing protein [Enterococcus hulanensis]|uniref:DUF3991 domain-containing protein n=1 Tax=Enterococcus hulanensis TaxID=2559929 RepID=UPI0010F9FC6D|nr:DUF3991 domain-containing protein [Enterococcus hulanensis]